MWQRHIEDDDHEVLWIILKPKKLPRKYSCIIIACIYHPSGADNGSFEYLITDLDTILRRSPDCGVILTGYFNQFKDLFLRTHYGYEQLVKAATRNRAILNKIWSNMSPVYGCPTVLDGVGTSDHKMVLLVPSCFPTLDTGWSRASLPGVRVTMNEQCLHQRCHVPDGSICTHCLRARNSLISSRKPWTIYWARVFRTRLCHVIAQINHGSQMASGTCSDSDNVLVCLVTGTGQNTEELSESHSAKIAQPVLPIKNRNTRGIIDTWLVETNEASHGNVIVI